MEPEPAEFAPGRQRPLASKDRFLYASGFEPAPTSGSERMYRLNSTMAAVSLTVAATAAAAGEAGDLPHAFEAGWQGQQTCALLFEDASVRVARCEFPPGVGHEKHYHNPHFGYVLDGGTLRIRDSGGEREITTTAGGSWSTDEVTVHEAVNIGATTTSYLIVEPVTR
jgi:quercetin dioxygenase-like cupin family protein